MTTKKSNCELCGRKEERLSYSYVEGVRLEVCSKCAGFGKFADEVKIPSKHDEKEQDARKSQNDFQQVHQDELEEVVVSNYAQLIHAKREKLGLSQKVFASKLNEKESFVASLENGKMPLGIEQARKLGKLLGLDLIVREKIVHLGKNERSGAVTIGDVLLKLKR